MHLKHIGWWLAAVLVASCGSDDDGAVAGMGAAGMADLGGGTAVATIAPFAMGVATGTATFTQSGTDVSVVVSLTNCPDGEHPVHIHQGVSCADADMQGGHWDMMRGEGIPNVVCAGGVGTSMLTRPATNPLLGWSIGGAAATNVVGHAFVVHDAGDPAPRTGCGLIVAQ